MQAIISHFVEDVRHFDGSGLEVTWGGHRTGDVERGFDCYTRNGECVVWVGLGGNEF